MSSSITLTNLILNATLILWHSRLKTAPVKSFFISCIDLLTLTLRQPLSWVLSNRGDKNALYGKEIS